MILRYASYVFFPRVRRINDWAPFVPWVYLVRWAPNRERNDGSRLVSFC
jgi:hypothetical protein